MENDSELNPVKTGGHEPTKWEKYAKGKKPSMKRRCNLNDYLDRGIYMITMAIEGRKPLLGRLVGTTEKEVKVELSPFGEKVKECWMAIAQHYPQIEVVKICMMPDHIHGVLYVHERIEKHLGHVINGFKIGCRKAAREFGLMTAAMPQFTEQKERAAYVKYSEAVPQSHNNHQGLIWEKNYNDRILRGRGQYQKMLDYIDDNPRRLFLKHQHPEYLSNLGTFLVAGLPMQAMGNRYLLDKPIKLQVQCSRHLYQNEIDERKEFFLQEGRNGAVLVSPCISPGESQIATAALNAHIPLIVLLLNGLPPLFKPKPRYLEACCEGRLLLLAPFPYKNEKITDMRHRCLELNKLAAKICEE